MGAWIEICSFFLSVVRMLCRTPRWVRGLKLNAFSSALFISCRTPRWVRGLKLIECDHWPRHTYVAPHDGCVDWNRSDEYDKTILYWIAPHDGCVDWNTYWGIIRIDIQVAPHDGCVDWNKTITASCDILSIVAPHDGCVDWNRYISNSCPFRLWSHPTMGAWIEIW